MKPTELSYALSNWTRLNETLRSKLSATDLKYLLDTERENRNRKSFLERIQIKLSLRQHSIAMAELDNVEPQRPGRKLKVKV